jgi:peptidoglycan/xylan/chitin deacetylase (PgdA/CDA1 family)
MRLYRPLFFSYIFYRKALFRIKSSGKVLYLTFDDGPHPDSTIPILNILRKFPVKAIFFCTGDQAIKNPALLKEITSEGHIIGNHGFYHIDGFKSSSKKYIENIELAARITSDRIFRPPYGRLRLSQYRKAARSYTIFMWDVMGYDFDRQFGKERSLAILKDKLRAGSIIVLHDSPDSSSVEFLEEFIMYCESQHYTFDLPPVRIY